MNKKQKRIFYRIISALAVFILGCLPFSDYLRFLLPVAYIIIGYDILWKAVSSIVRGKMLDENFLMSIATIGALALEQWSEAVFVMLFYQTGELFQSIAVGKSRKSIAGLMELRPDNASVLRGESTQTVSPDEVKVGEVIVVRPGERVPLDGVIINGGADMDMSALTGESVPVYCGEGDSAISGSVVIDSVVRIRVQKPYTESTAMRILELTENAAVSKAQSEKFITRFARIYTPAVVAASVVLALVPPIFTGGFTVWLHRSLTFLVISCPCALVISVPMTFFCGIGSMSRQGILVKGGGFIESLANAGCAVFDKTGTLTSGKLTAHCDDEHVLELAAYAEYYSTHPIAVAILEKYGKEIDKSCITDIKELAGLGVSAVICGKEIKAGNIRLMPDATPVDTGEGTCVYVSEDGKYIGKVTLTDALKPDAKDAISGLHDIDIPHTVMLTGDRQESAQAAAKALGITDVYAELMPQDKVDIMSRLIKETAPSRVIFTGDGINDAPVLAMADVGVAMGALGSDAAIEAADVVIMDDAPSKLISAIKMSKKVCRIVRQNIIFVLAVKAAVLALSAFGFASMWAAVFADVGVAVIAILNALRTNN